MQCTLVVRVYLWNVILGTVTLRQLSLGETLLLAASPVFPFSQNKWDSVK